MAPALRAPCRLRGVGNPAVLAEHLQTFGSLLFVIPFLPPLTVLPVLFVPCRADLSGLQHH